MFDESRPDYQRIQDDKIAAFCDYFGMKNRLRQSLILLKIQSRDRKMLIDGEYTRYKRLLITSEQMFRGGNVG